MEAQWYEKGLFAVGVWVYLKRKHKFQVKFIICVRLTVMLDAVECAL